MQITDKARSEFVTISDSFKMVAEGYAQELVDAGLDVRTAGTAVANIMIRQAYIVAGSSKLLMTGEAPDPAVFLEAAKSMIETVHFRPVSKDGETGLFLPEEKE